MMIQKLMLAMLVIVAVEARRENRLQDLTPEQRREIEYWVGAFRSFWTGFQRDLYQTEEEKLDSRCFDEESEDEIAEIYWAYKETTFDNLFDACITLLNLFYDDYVVCHYQDAVQKFVHHCKVSEGACNLDHIFKNLAQSIFSILAIGSSVGDVFANFSVMKTDEMEQIMMQLGRDTSQFLRAVLGIKYSKYDHSSLMEEED